MKKYFIIPILLCLTVFLFVGCEDNSEPLNISSIEGIKTTYICDEPMQSGNTNVTIYYNNNESKDVKLSQLEISGFDTSTVGTKTLTITFNELTYSELYQVKYKSIRNNSINGIPNSFIANSNITLSKYKIDVERFNGFKTIPLNDSSVTVEGLTARNVLNATSKYIYDASAKISCGGVNFTHNYSVWYTQGYNESLSGQKNIDGYIVEVKNFRVMQNYGLDGYLILKNASGGTLSTHNLTGWAYGSIMLELKDNNTTIAKYDYTAKTLYVMDNAFSQFNYEFSINVN